MNTNRKTFRAAQWGKVLLLGFLAMGLPGHGEATSGSFNAPIEIVTKKLGALNVSFLRFGGLGIFDDVGGSSVTITPIIGFPFHICTSSNAGSGACDPNVTGAAQFLITGADNAVYNFTLPNTIPLTDTSNNSVITGLVGTNVTALSENLVSASGGQLDADGNDRVFVGATIEYFGFPAGGDVTSNFTISVNYLP